MSVHPGQHAEHKRCHRPICRELAETFLGRGASTYPTYLDQATGALCGYVEVDSERLWGAVAASEAWRRWWRSMGDIMPARSDDNRVSRPPREVGHLKAVGR